MPFLDLAEEPRVSFRYDGKDSGEFLAGWKHSTSTEQAPGGSVTHFTHCDPTSGLKVVVHVRRFDDFPAVDWVAEFENCGPADTPIIENILPLDISIPISPKERLRLHHANGSSCGMADFLPLTDELRPNTNKTLAPEDGRSSNGAFPFLNLQRSGCGLVLALGWSGQWQASLRRGEDSLRLAAGMERTHLRLHPGEKIRTPRILLLPWEGNEADEGNNLFRRLLIAYYLPRVDGELVMPPVAQCLQGYYYLTGKAGEQFEMKALPKAGAIGTEVYWIDACWYGGGERWWKEAGSWAVNRERFPHGLKPISDAAHKAGMKFLLWFEPERVYQNSQIHREHPEFCLASEDNPENLLFNLGLPEAREYITDLISGFISENGIDIYRQDFNFDPLPYWQAADGPDRVGMTEIRYVEGHYAFWDELRRRYPRMWIDNCASGGRRIDLETVSRSLPLWPSDFIDVSGLTFGQGLHLGDQCIRAGLARWVPLFGGGLWNFTPYGARSGSIGGVTFGFHIDHQDFPSDETSSVITHNDVLAKGKTLLDDDFPLDLAREAIKERKSLRPYCLGDFYLLLPLTVSVHDWCAWQFHRGDSASGIAIFLRRHQSPFPTMKMELKCIVPDAEYEVSLSADYREAPHRQMKGSELGQMSITIPETPGSLLLRYRQVK